MSDLYWSNYIRSEEYASNATCYEHSLKYGIDGLNTEIDCDTLPCNKDCPLRGDYHV